MPPLVVCACARLMRPTHASDSCMYRDRVSAQSTVLIDSSSASASSAVPLLNRSSSLLFCSARAKPLRSRYPIMYVESSSELALSLDYAISTTQSRHSKPQLPTSQPSRWSLAACRGHRRRSPLRRTHTRPREAATRLLLSHRQQTLVSSRGP